MLVWFSTGNLSDDLTNKVFVLNCVCLTFSSKINKPLLHDLMDKLTFYQLRAKSSKIH